MLYSRNKIILVFEPELKGHQPEFIFHICEYISAQSEQSSVIFVVHPDFLFRFGKTFKNFINHPTQKISFICLTYREYNLCSNHNLPIRSLWKWFLMVKYLKATGANHGHFLNIDHLQLPLALKFPLPKNKTISGILFQPSNHYSCFFQNSFTFKENFKNLRKNFFYKIMLSHQSLIKVFSLDPYFSEFAENNYKFGSKVEKIPDPVPYNYSTNSENRKTTRTLVKIKIPKKRIVFLLFGSLARRKGIIEVLEAIKFLDSDIKKKTAIVFAGKIEPDIFEEFSQKQAHISSTEKNILLHIENRYIPEQELSLLIDQSDIILATYQRFIGSSGILLRASQAQKPVIAQNFGLIGAFVKSYELGLAINTTSPKCISDAITISVRNNGKNMSSKAKMKEFIQGRTPERFAHTIFSNL